MFDSFGLVLLYAVYSIQSFQIGCPFFSSSSSSFAHSVAYSPFRVCFACLCLYFVRANDSQFHFIIITVTRLTVLSGILWSCYRCCCSTIILSHKRRIQLIFFNRLQKFHVPYVRLNNVPKRRTHMHHPYSLEIVISSEVSKNCLFNDIVNLFFHSFSNYHIELDVILCSCIQHTAYIYVLHCRQ